jgi:hypothetical protein
MSRRLLAVVLVFSTLATFAPVVSAAGPGAPVRLAVSDGQMAEIVLSGDTYHGPQIQSPFAGDEDGLDNSVITADIQVTYTGFTAESMAAFEAAVQIWERLIYSPKPIHVDANWAAMAPGVLGSAGPAGVWVDDGTYGSKAWPQALLEAICNCEQGTGTTPADPDFYEIEADFSSAYSDWYLGTDGKPAGTQVDFVSVVLHELGHGLGFSTSGFVFNPGNGQGSWGFVSGTTKTNFGLELWDGVSGCCQLMNTAFYPNPSTTLGAALTSDAVWFGLTNVTSLGSGRARMYAPTTWAPGSSIHHLDDATYDGTINSLMTHAISLGEANHNPGPITLAILRDIGWDSEGCFAAPFPDVAISHPFCLEIRWMKDNAISTGFGDGNYHPGDVVTRQAMSAFMARLAGVAGSLPACASEPFPDVPTGHTFCKEIKWMKDTGISAGFGDGNYHPADAVTRQAMSAFMARLALGAAGASALSACSVAPFPDVPTGHPFCKEIKWMKDTGVSIGFGDGSYHPGDAVSRQAMSAFMFRVNSQLT